MSDIPFETDDVSEADVLDQRTSVSNDDDDENAEVTELTDALQNDAFESSPDANPADVWEQAMLDPLDDEDDEPS